MNKARKTSDEERQGNRIKEKLKRVTEQRTAEFMLAKIEREARRIENRDWQLEDTDTGGVKVPDDVAEAKAALGEVKHAREGDTGAAMRAVMAYQRARWHHAAIPDLLETVALHAMRWRGKTLEINGELRRRLLELFEARDSIKRETVVATLWDHESIAGEHDGKLRKLISDVNKRLREHDQGVVLRNRKGCVEITHI
jgi:hypothetical protein